MQIEALFFDLDETLLDDSAGILESATFTARDVARRYAGVDLERLVAAYYEAANRFWSAVDGVPMTPSGKTDQRSIRTEVWGQALTAAGISDPAAAVDAADTYAAERVRNYVPYDDAEPALAELHGSLPLGLITNGAVGGQREKLDTIGLTEYFDYVAVSGELGFGKPGPEIFEAALDALGVPAARAAHVGDRLEYDVVGALNAGMFAVWLNRNGATAPPGLPRPDAEIEGLGQLSTALQGLAG